MMFPVNGGPALRAIGPGSRFGVCVKCTLNVSYGLARSSASGDCCSRRTASGLQVALATGKRGAVLCKW